MADRLIAREVPDRPTRRSTRQDGTGHPRYGMEVFPDQSVPIKVLFLDRELMPHGALHSHDYFQICYIYKGECEHRIGKAERRLVPGDLFIVPPGILHSLKAAGGDDTRLFLCDFMPVFVRELFVGSNRSSSVRDFAYIEPFLASEDKVRSGLRLSGTPQVEVERLLFGMAEECRTMAPGWGLVVRGRLLELLVVLWRRYEQSESEGGSASVVRNHVDSINATLAYLEEHYREDLKLKDVCSYAMMSQSYFSRFFKLVTKKTFVDYMHDLRVRKAMELLRSTMLKVADVCYEVGFGDVSHFNRVFRSKIGMSPTLYRKRAARERD